LSWKDLGQVDIKKIIVENSGGDGRRALNLLESLHSFFIAQGSHSLKENQIQEALKYTPIRYDKSRDMHYDTISAFIKSIRGSDPDGALFYLARMLKGGENPLFIARRLVILASEDIGNADPRALQVALNAKDAVDFVGLPEGAINLAQAVTYLATSPKSNRSYMGLRKAEALVERFPNVEIPKSIRNAPTKLMKNLGYGKDYQYAHDSETGVTPQSFMPDEIKNQKLYVPTTRGHEKNVTAYLEWVKTQI
jgi:putative ATPase